MPETFRDTDIVLPVAKKTHKEVGLIQECIALSGGDIRIFRALYRESFEDNPDLYEWSMVKAGRVASPEQLRRVAACRPDSMYVTLRGESEREVRMIQDLIVQSRHCVNRFRLIYGSLFRCPPVLYRGRSIIDIADTFNLFRVSRN